MYYILEYINKYKAQIQLPWLPFPSDDDLDSDGSTGKSSVYMPIR